MPTIIAADPTKALAAYLKATVGDLVSGRVYRPELPQPVDKSMAQACLVIRPAGGGKMFGQGQLRVFDPVIDVICYGGSALEAHEVALAVVIALKQLTVGVWENCKLYWARVAGGPLPLLDPQTLWPASLVSTQVMHAQTAGTEDPGNRH